MMENILIKKAQKGDSHAFEALIEAHFKQIYNIAFRMTNNPDDAADMTQEVMLKLFRNIGSFSGNSKFSTWVYRVATNTCLDELKKINRKSAISLQNEIETDDGGYTMEIEDNSLTPEQSAEQNELKDIVAKAIAKLNDDHKTIIILRDIRGFSYDEIARIIGTSEGTVKSRLSRARAQLKNIVEKDFGFDGTYFNK